MPDEGRWSAGSTAMEPHPLADGLVLRRATPADTDAVAELTADVLRPQDMAEPSPAMAAWVRDLYGERHPTFRASDGVVVEDTRRHAIVSAMLLYSHTWSFGGVPIAVGQPELVGTRTEYRGRGLVRAMFETVHRWSAERGQQVIAINGVPWFYRQFGYEMALPLGGGPKLYTAGLAGAPSRSEPEFRVRAAVETDAAFLSATSAQADRRYVITTPRDEASWRYVMAGRRADSAVATEVRIVETSSGDPVGYVEHARRLWAASGALPVRDLEVTPGVSWRTVATAVLRDLLDTAHTYASAEHRECGVLQFWLLGRDHPITRVLQFAGADRPYAFYVRVPDLADLLRRITPVLERRLADSPLAGHSAELRLSFYRDGLHLRLERGALKSVEAWRPPFTAAGVEMGQPSTDERRAAATFPDLTFLHLIFGSRSLAEMEAAFPDCLVRTAEARALLDVLFPKVPSRPLPVL
jgi:predicted N-acetyltransferase YhbS